MENRIINAAILEDHPIVAEAVAERLEKLKPAFVASFSPEKVRAGVTDISSITFWVLDIELGDISGYDMIAYIKEHAPDSVILVYTMHDSPWVARRLVKEGVTFAVSKSDPVDELDMALRKYAEGYDGYFSTSFRCCDSESKTLSRREMEILKLLALGMGSGKIAESLNISENTVLTYRKSLMEKFNVHKASDLIILSRGLV